MTSESCEIAMKEFRCYPIIWANCPWILAVDTKEDSGRAETRKGSVSKQPRKNARNDAMELDKLATESESKSKQKRLSFQVNVLKTN